MRTFLPRANRLASLAGLVMAAALICWGCTRRPAPVPVPPRGVGLPLGQLKLQPLAGDAPPVSLSSLRGAVVLLNFWGTWCPPCREELPHIAEIFQRRGGDADFRLLAVSCGNRGNDSDVDGLRRETSVLLKKMDLAMPTYADPDEVTREAVDRVAGFEGYPTTLVLDRRGIIRGIWVNS